MAAFGAVFSSCAFSEQLDADAGGWKTNDLEQICLTGSGLAFQRVKSGAGGPACGHQFLLMQLPCNETVSLIRRCSTQIGLFMVQHDVSRFRWSALRYGGTPGKEFYAKESQPDAHDCGARLRGNSLPDRRQERVRASAGNSSFKLPLVQSAGRHDAQAGQGSPF